MRSTTPWRIAMCARAVMGVPPPRVFEDVTELARAAGGVRMSGNFASRPQPAGSQTVVTIRLEGPAERPPADGLGPRNENGGER